MRIYGDLAPWFHLLTAPADYAAEAERYRSLIQGEVPDARTLLELGSGGGNNACHLKAHFTCTLSDLSPQMLTLSRRAQPGVRRTSWATCGHSGSAARSTPSSSTTRSRTWQPRTTSTTAWSPRSPTRVLGGVAVFVPDFVRENFQPRTSHGGHDGHDGRSLRYLEWSIDPDPSDTSYEVDFAVVLREPDQEPRVVLDHHVEGLFPEHTWRYLLDQVGFETTVHAGIPDDENYSQHVFVARRPA